MKTIQVSDEDYEILMELSKELQTQNNIGQAFPYFWVPRSSKSERDFNNEGTIRICYDIRNCETHELEEMSNLFPEMRESFLDLYEEYEDDDDEWFNFIGNDPDFDTWTEKLVKKEETNPSLFYSDVKRFCSSNSHHLGEDPHPYARSIWRMPKMESLVKCILRLNTNHGETVNNEAKRFLPKEPTK